jgi:hypothetical protein
MKRIRALKWYWKTLIVLSLFLTIVTLSIDHIAEYYANKQILKIKAQFDGKYDFSYDNIDVRLVQRSIVLKNFKFFSVTDSAHSQNKVDFQLDKLFLHLNDYMGLVIDGELNIKKVGIYNPSITNGLKKLNNDEKELETNVTVSSVENKDDLFLKQLNIAEFVLENGKSDVYRLVKPENKILFIDDLDISMTGISIDFTTDSLFAGTSIETLIFNASKIISNDLKYHELSIENLHYDISSEGFSIDKFHIKNKQSREAFNTEQKYRTPWIEVDVEKIEFDVFPWDVYKNGIFDLRKIVMTQADINLFVDLNLPLSPKIKPMPSKMIRSVPEEFNIDTIQLIDATFIFENKMKGENPGHLKLAPINGYMTHITNVPEYLINDPLMKLDIDCKIWDEGDVEIYIEIDVPNVNDPMFVKGQVVDLSLKKTENMIKNLFGIGVKSGHLDLLKFEYLADDSTSVGEMVFDYSNFVLDFKVQDKKEESNDGKKYSEKSKRFLNFLVKEAVVENNIPGTKKYIQVGYIQRDRIRDKAFSDALWGSIEVGISDIAIKDTFYDSRKNYSKQESKKNRKTKKQERVEEKEINKADQTDKKLNDDNNNSDKKGRKKKRKKKKL